MTYSGVFYGKLTCISFVQNIFLCLALILFTDVSAEARPYRAAISFLLPAKDVYLVRVTGIKQGAVTFTVKEVLRGRPTKRLILHPYLNEKYLLSTDWILASCAWGTDKQSVGLTEEDYCGWVQMSVTRKDGQAFVMLGGERGEGLENIKLDMASDGTEGLTLNHIRQLLQK